MAWSRGIFSIFFSPFAHLACIIQVLMCISTYIFKNMQKKKWCGWWCLADISRWKTRKFNYKIEKPWVSSGSLTTLSDVQCNGNIRWVGRSPFSFSQNYIGIRFFSPSKSKGLSSLSLPRDRLSVVGLFGFVVLTHRTRRRRVSKNTVSSSSAFLFA